MKTTSSRKRPKSPSIRLITDSAPWVLLSRAAAESGLSQLLIRKSGIVIRKFGTAHYVAPAQLNAWILGGDGDGELCDTLAGLDPKVAQAVVAMIAARAHLAGDADDIVRPLLNRKEGPAS